MAAIKARNNFAFYCNKSQFCENEANFYARNSECAIIGMQLLQLLHDPFKLALQALVVVLSGSKHSGSRGHNKTIVKRNI